MIIGYENVIFPIKFTSNLGKYAKYPKMWRKTWLSYKNTIRVRNLNVKVLTICCSRIHMAIPKFFLFVQLHCICVWRWRIGNAEQFTNIYNRVPLNSSNKKNRHFFDGLFQTQFYSSYIFPKFASRMWVLLLSTFTMMKYS